MADYRRLVSYIYNYESHIKKNNVGYARVEVRSGKCKVTVHINVLSMNESELKVCFFTRKNKEIQCIPLGGMIPKNGTGDFQIITEADNLAGTGIDITQAGGMILYASGDKYFGTQWDDEPIYLKEFKTVQEHPGADVMVRAAELEPDEEPEERKVPENPIKEDEETVRADEVAAVLEPELEEQSEPEEVNEEQNELFQNESHASAGEAEKPIWEEPLIRPPADCRQEDKTSSGAKSIEPEPLQTEYGKRKTEADPVPYIGLSPEQGMKIFTSFPKIYPFEDDEIIECIRIEPQDIGIFPMECWDLANNSFLLHGYYSYRHLIFVKRKWGDGFQYVVGVPGIFYNREKFMAGMFGFEQFKSIKKTEQKSGEFGYWLHVIP